MNNTALFSRGGLSPPQYTVVTTIQRFLREHPENAWRSPFLFAMSGLNAAFVPSAFFS